MDGWRDFDIGNLSSTTVLESITQRFSRECIMQLYCKMQCVLHVTCCIHDKTRQCNKNVLMLVS